MWRGITRGEIRKFGEKINGGSNTKLGGLNRRTLPKFFTKKKSLKLHNKRAHQLLNPIYIHLEVQRNSLCQHFS